MRYLALATDYDGTLAADGRVSSSTIQALETLRKTGRRLLLVTGRELPDLKRVFDRLDLFDLVVAENGALLFNPHTQSETVLSEPPSEEFTKCLAKRGVQFSVGRNIVATSTEYADQVLRAIQETGLELQVIFNKGAAMVLPTGVNKATGLLKALEELRLAAHNVVAVGDAENDHALLSTCEFGVAVANAVPLLKQRADWVTEGARGTGVEQLIQKIVEDDLCSFDESLTRNRIRIGEDINEGEEIYVPQSRGSLLVTGPSGSGKSTITSALIEQMTEQNYQFCLIDPEGDYDGLPGAIMIGTPSDAPNLVEIEKALEIPSRNVVINLLAIPLADRPLFFAGLLPRLLELRAHSGRPHWIVVDEAHHLLPSSWVPAPAMLPQQIGGMLLITVHPTFVAPAALQSIDTLIMIGKGVRETLSGFAEKLGITPPVDVPVDDLSPDQAAVWLRSAPDHVRLVKAARSSFDRRRHTRKYAEGDLPEDRSFYFRGPNGKLNLRAQNLNIFIQIATGVDDDTWMFHLDRNEYSNWIRTIIKDDELADEIHQIEQSGDAPAESRERVKEAVERRYTTAA
ncbi:MAG TPA: HAD-IIB family hydrolase [Terriglobales bacterium]|nr:HAD-IIB family hydrolase [Terriglobales bacterium]